MTFTALYTWCEDYDNFIGIVCILGGLWLLMVGGRYYKITMFVATVVILTIAICLILFIDIMPDSTPEWVVWEAIVLGIVMGSYFGYAA